MFSKIIKVPEKKLIGLSTELSLANDTTAALWQKFMPQRSTIKNRVDDNFYSMQVYTNGLSLDNFTPQTSFTKWATVEVDSFSEIPSGLDTYLLSGGLYAVFRYKGLPKDFPTTLQYIFQEWLPKSGYTLDNREHFEVLGKDYKRNDPSSEEDIYIPIKAR